MQAPHVVLLPGFLGIDLVDRTGARLWFDPATFLSGNVDIAERIALDPSGTHDADPRWEVRPTEPIRFVYGELCNALRAAGVALDVFIFDYRKSLLAAAKDLRAFVAARIAPGERVWLVGHSIGGPLAALYPYADPRASPPAIDPSWRSTIAGTVLYGGTLLGTLEPIAALTGTHWFLKVVGGGDRGREDAMRRCMSTWPGLAGLMPDPRVFTGTARAYDAASWPEGYRPAQRDLDEAALIRRLVAESPLFEAPVTQFLSDRYHTAGALTAATSLGLLPRAAPGDDTVPLFAASPNASVRLFRAGFPHTFMPADPDVVRATIDIVHTGRSASHALAPIEANVTLAGAPLAPPMEMLVGMGSSLLHDLAHGIRSLASVWPHGHGARSNGA